MLEMLFQLIIGHALLDFPLQGDSMAKGKNRNRSPENIPPGQTPQRVWPYWLTSHALIHAGGVWLVTQRWELALAEAVSHWVIDFAKCENWTGIHTDQLLHFVCKVLWVGLLMLGVL